MGKWLLRILAALLGFWLALGLYCSFALVRVEGSDMLPTLEPGDYVMVHAGVAIAKITDEDEDETDQLMEELL